MKIRLFKDDSMPADSFMMRSEDGRDIFIQFQADIEGVAETFGWDGSGFAFDYLMAHYINEPDKYVDDPGYFQETTLWQDIEKLKEDGHLSY